MKKKKSIPRDDQEIPELTREQLGEGVRGKYYQRMMKGYKIVILRPKPSKACTKDPGGV